MGLDTTHNAWHGPYSSFNRWRTNIAKLIGIDLDKMAGFSGTIPWDRVTDHLKDLLYHSDCDGELTPEQCEAIAKRLRELIPNMQFMDDFTQKEMIELTEQFAKGCELAASRNEVLEFG